MTAFTITRELILLALPLIIIQYGLSIYCTIDILKKGTKNLNQATWILIVFFINIFGSIIYLNVGKRKDL
ncbi:MAG: hypothetical protein A2Y45_08170 [Tenericutes bacterium GWC2_34_14]|nr:MAG: hypothetical protein A2Z84_01235 [Tenericutes bacterium GWA2_35_7]OHE29872.1 MAG: hypothetical protein A2Y45_08170 [Tenericutes bacterium GWC2_34_14]OHE34851.1 MAG: hypothetical protein A2012_01780 [Tenericutes bacterium GWE2_34_108]OHE37288.1 MAG: hypothetical protein A2Y46_01230 [Tenericutes bacterium GWF1_35_14]OHE39579.1 MAG: hypothetical protein A2Y44_01630 [Tenericutes bacterium GWF2_35_184]OHE41281.1 MAG: hypothetical protein A3K26_06265 [Tenericutes bacterium RIFOXYA12_FULL_35_